MVGGGGWWHPGDSTPGGIPLSPGVESGMRVRGFHARALVDRCRENMAHIRQSNPDSGLGVHIEVLKLFPLRSDAGRQNESVRVSVGPSSSSSLLSSLELSDTKVFEP